MLKRFFIYFLVFLLFPQNCVILFANEIITSGNTGVPEITVDHSLPQNGQLPTLDLSQNNVPIVNITSPNGDGISVNYYNDFNVAERGLLVNNSVNYGQSQIAGAVYGNPNFAPFGRESDIILQEVTGLNFTHLNGYTEIFGKKAEYIIANPNGILVEGGGFINTSKLTLAASDAELINGTIKFNSQDINLSSYHQPASGEFYIPEKGMILITGTNEKGHSGLDAGGVDNVSLISRALQVAQKITAKDKLQIITGLNDIQYQKAGDNFITRVKNYSVLPSGSSAVNTSTPQNGSSNSNGSPIDSGIATGDAPQDPSRVLPSNSSLTSLDSDGNTITTDTSYSQDANGIVTSTKVETTDFVDILLPDKTIKTIQIFTPINPDTDNSSTQIETIIKQVNQDGSETIISDTTEIKADEVETISTDDTFGSTDGMTHGGTSGSSNSLQNAKDIPTVAIDTYSLGGIYANKVYIIATENGVASRFASEVVAQDSMQINSNGDVVYNNLTAQNDINISSAIAVKNMNATEDKKTSTYKSLTDISYTDSMGETVNKQVETYNNSTIYANNVNINANNITNNGLIYTKNNANLSANLIYNEYGAIVSENDINLGKIINGNLTKNNQIVNYTGLIQAENDINISTQKLDNTRDVTVSKKQWTGIADIHPGSTAYQNWNPLVKHLFYDEINDPRRSYILGGNITINATELNNIGSTISSEKDLTITADKINNQSISIEDTYKNYYMSWEFIKKVCKWYRFGGCRNVYGWKQRAYETYNYREEAAQLIAGRDMIIETAEQLNNGNIQNYADYNNIISQNNYHLQQTKLDVNSVSNVLAQTGANFFAESKNPSSSYVIETNPLFTNVDAFKGSQYLFDRLGINFFTEETRNKRLIGDAYWENAFIKQQLLEMTGKRFLSQDIASDKAQLEALYANSAIEGTSLNLKIGTELTKEQVSNLQKDIVWYVAQQITLLDGSKETVLVPKLYLSKITEDNLDYITGKNSSIISANGNLQITGNGTNNELSLNNYGQIISKEDLTISTNFLVNRAYTDGINNGLISGQNALIKSIGDIINLSGKLSGEDLLTLISTDGSLLSETDKRRTFFEKSFKEYEASAKFGFTEVRDYKDNLSQNAYISGGNVIIETGKDTILIGSNIAAENDLNINTKGNFLTTTQTLESKDTRITSSASLFKKSETINIDYYLNNVGSEITAKNVNVISNSNNLDKLSNINVYGSGLNAIGDVNLMANGDINLLTSQDYEKHIYERTEIKADITSMIINSVIGALMAVSGGMVPILGSISSGMSIGAGIGVGVGSFSGNNIKVETKITENFTNHQSQINSNNISIISNQDINLVSTKLTAENDLSLIASKDINIYDAQDVTSETYTVYKKSTDWTSALFDTLTLQAPIKIIRSGAEGLIKSIEDNSLNSGFEKYNDTVLTSKENTQNTSMITRENIMSDLKAENINLIADENNLISGSNLTAEKDLNIISNNNTIISAQSQVSETQSSQEKSNGIIANMFGNNNSTKETTQTQSNLSAENINISSGYNPQNGERNTLADQGNLYILGSKLNSSKDINLIAENEINISSLENIIHTKNTSYEFTPDAGSVMLGATSAAAGALAAATITYLTLGTGAPAGALIAGAATSGAMASLRNKKGEIENYERTEINQVQSNLASNNNISLISGNDTNITSSDLTAKENIFAKVGTIINENNLQKTNLSSQLNLMANENTISESYSEETITPNYGAITGIQFGMGALQALTSGTIGAMAKGASTGILAALNSGTSTIAGQVSSTLISNAVANQTTDLLIDLFNCKSNDGCKIATAMLGGAAGGLAGWKAGNMIDKALIGDVTPLRFEDVTNVNLFQKIINITIDEVYQPFISAGAGGSTNPLSLINLPDLKETTDESSYNFKEIINSNLSAKNIYVE